MIYHWDNSFKESSTEEKLTNRQQTEALLVDANFAWVKQTQNKICGSQKLWITLLTRNPIFEYSCRMLSSLWIIMTQREASEASVLESILDTSSIPSEEPLPVLFYTVMQKVQRQTNQSPTNTLYTYYRNSLNIQEKMFLRKNLKNWCHGRRYYRVAVERLKPDFVGWTGYLPFAN